MYTLHVASTPNGLKPLILLEELGVGYELARVDFSKNQQKSPEFLAMNPNGRIPVLQDDGLTIFESGAILIHLAEKEGRFLATGGAARAQALEWLMFQMSAIGPMFGQLNHFATFAPEKIPYAIERYRNECLRLLAVLDTRLGEAPFLAGDYGIADMATWPWIQPLPERGVPLDAYPNVARWVGSVGARPSVETARLLLYGK